MGEHHFGLGPGHLPRVANTIAKKHDAWLVNYAEPSGEKRHWFSCKNRGAPFDGATADAVLAELRMAGLIEELETPSGSVRVHVTRIRGRDVYGHATSHCDDSGCSGDELYWSDIDGNSISRGDVVTLIAQRRQRSPES